MIKETTIIKKVNSPERRILAHFLDGNSLTVKEAQRFGTTELRKVVSRLIEKGWPIISEWEQDGDKRFKRYRIEPVALLDRKIAEAQADVDALKWYYSEPTIS